METKEETTAQIHTEPSIFIALRVRASELGSQNVTVNLLLSHLQLSVTTASLQP